jgi:hypothetical protein
MSRESGKHCQVFPLSGAAPAKVPATPYNPPGNDQKPPVNYDFAMVSMGIIGKSMVNHLLSWVILHHFPWRSLPENSRGSHLTGGKLTSRWVFSFESLRNDDWPQFCWTWTMRLVNRLISVTSIDYSTIWDRSHFLSGELLIILVDDRYRWLWMGFFVYFANVPVTSPSS